MISLKNCGAFLFVGVCALRVVACSANTGKPGGIGGAFGAGGGSIAQSGGGGMAGMGTPPLSTGSSASSNTGGYLPFNTGGGAMDRDMDSSCHPVSEVPEKIVVTDSSIAPVAIFIMQDRSGSMVFGGNGASAMSWDNSAAALTSFVQDPMSQGLDMGLGTFPVGNNNTFDCNGGSDCGNPVVPIAPLTGNATTGNAPLIIDAYTAQKPTTMAITPTECALRGMINRCLVHTSQTGEKCVAVLVTDGTPTQCNGDENFLTSIIADGFMKGVETFTLGLPGADLNVLNGYAKAGGSMQAIDVSAGSAAFVQALNAIRTKVQTKTVVETPLRCQWGIPPSDPNEPPFDPKQVNVQFTPPNMPAVELGHVPSKDACPATGNGWYYDDEKAPKQIFLCKATCDSISTVPDARIDLLFHCPTKPYTVQ